jgi:hypothetical protein
MTLDFMKFHTSPAAGLKSGRFDRKRNFRSGRFNQKDRDMPTKHLKQRPLTGQVASRLWRWIKNDFFGIAREMRWSYLPPLMVYFAAGVSGFTGIIESFFVKEELGLTAAFLAGLGFWGRHLK